MAETTYKSILKERNYMKNLIASLISRFGDSIDAIAYSWIMYEVTNNASLIALIMALNYIPTIFFQPFLAVLVERTEKKKVIAYTSFGRGLIVLCTVILYLTGNITGVYLMVSTFLTSTLEAFSLPAGNAFVPMLIPMEKMTAAKSLSASACTLVELAGMSLAGPVIAFWGSHIALFLDFITFILSALLILTIPFKEETKGVALTVTEYKKDLSEGFRYVLSSRLLVCMIGIGMYLNMINVPFSSFQSIFVGDYLKLDAQALSVFSVTMMAGMLLGSMISPKLSEKIGVRKGIILSGLLFSPFYFAEAFLPVSRFSKSRIYAVSILGFLVFGIGLGLLNVLFSTVFIQCAAREYLARVSGIANALLSAMMPVMALICSFLAIFLKVNVIFLVVGICNLLIFLLLARAKIMYVLDRNKNGVNEE